jgi:hypothetical protein
MEIYNFNLAIVFLLIFLVTVKYIPGVFPAVPIVNMVSSTIVHKMPYIILLSTLIFFVIIWLDVNKIDLAKADATYEDSNEDVGGVEIGTMSI